MKTTERPESEQCGPTPSKNSNHKVELSETSNEDVNAELLTALKTINSDSTGTIDRIGLRNLLGGLRPVLDEPDLVDLLFIALGIDLGERCCLGRLLLALQPHLSNTIPSKLNREDVREAIRSFLDADSRANQRARPTTAVYALAPSPKNSAAARDRDAPAPSDLEAQPPIAPGLCAGRRCVALACCALLVAAAVTFGICLAVAKLGPGSSS